MIRAVLDTNVLFSGIFHGGCPGKLLELALDGVYHIVISQDILNEYNEVLLRTCKKRNIDSAIPLKVLKALISSSVLIETKKISTPFCEDPDDIEFLRAAIVSKAKYLVSGDKHLLRVKEFQHGVILKPNDFYKNLIKLST